MHSVTLMFILWMDMTQKESSLVFWDMRQQLLLKVSEKELPLLRLEILSFHAILQNVRNQNVFSAKARKLTYAQKSDLSRDKVF